MTRIFKYQLSLENPVTIPCQVIDVLHVNEQSGALFTWAEVTEGEQVACKLSIVATGERVPDGLHIGSIKQPINGILFMWHVYGVDVV